MKSRLYCLSSIFQLRVRVFQSLCHNFRRLDQRISSRRHRLERERTNLRYEQIVDRHVVLNRKSNLVRQFTNAAATERLATKNRSIYLGYDQLDGLLLQAFELIRMCIHASETADYHIESLAVCGYFVQAGHAACCFSDAGGVNSDRAAKRADGRECK